MKLFKTHFTDKIQISDVQQFCIQNNKQNVIIIIECNNNYVV